MISSNLSATTPKDQYINNLTPDQQSLYNNRDIPAGQPGSPWSLPPQPSQTTPSNSTISTPQSPVTNPLTTARSSYLDSFNSSSVLNSARQTYLDSFNSTAVNTAKQKYLDFTNSEQAGLNRIADKAIPMTFITGQQASLRRNSEATASRLQGDVSLAEQEATNAQNKAKLGLDFANTDFGSAQNKAQTNLGFATDDQNLGKVNQQFNLKNGINQPFYQQGNQVINSSTGQPEYQIVNINGNPTYQRISDQKLYSTPQDFFKDANITSWDQVQKDIGGTGNSTSTSSSSTNNSPTLPNLNKPISTSISNKYNLPSSITSGEFNSVNDSIKQFILQAGKVTDQNRYDLWGQVADGLKAAGIDPSIYDALLWENFSPDGLNGYKQYVLGKSGI